jgi:hypothetical protein
MKQRSELEPLLEDVFLDERVESLKASIRSACMAELSGKRGHRFRWWLVPAAAAVLLVALRVFVILEGEIPAPVQPDTPSYYVFTRPLDSGRLVTTSSSAVEPHRVHARSDRHFLVSRQEVVDVVRTEPTGRIGTLTDEEMLALFAGIPCALIEKGDNRKALIFIHAEDESRFMPKLGG